MYARVTTFAVPEQLVDNAVAFYLEHGVPGEKEEEGRLGGYLLFDPDGGKMMSVSLWQDEAAVKASEARSRERSGRAKEAGAVSVVCAVEHFKVVEGK